MCCGESDDIKIKYIFVIIVSPVTVESVLMTFDSPKIVLPVTSDYVLMTICSPVIVLPVTMENVKMTFDNLIYDSAVSDQL